MNKLLIANRGEIACRIARTARALGIATVAVYSEADAAALHREAADEAIAIGPASARESYLRGEAIIAAARQCGADAIHPGYGFLSENAPFARAVEAAGLTWVGPRADCIEVMGDKQRARGLAMEAGVPVLPGSPRFLPNDGGNAAAQLARAAAAVGFPLLVKAAGGGGGIGMRRVDTADALPAVVEGTQSMAAKAFGDAAIYMERLVPRARHIEVQVFGDGDGHAVHFFERECSVQRRFQKVIEESPAPGLPPGVRAAMLDAAVTLVKRLSYRCAGTVEFIVDARSHAFYFLEMNTRIQVEHPVTEACTGRDLVAMQLELARGAGFTLAQGDIQHAGHAIECRVYAENPAKHFMPSPGPLEAFSIDCEAPWLRVDSGYRSGDTVSFHYDPMVAKIIVHAANRAEALERMAQVLAATKVEGIRSNVAFLARCVRHHAFVAGELHTTFIDEHRAALTK